MTNLQALIVVNDQLGIGATITAKRDEVKCWIGDDENYLDANDCRELGAAFTALAASLAPGHGTGEKR